MAIVSTLMQAPPSRVLDVLANAEDYPRWVIGTRKVVAVDETWPAPGGAFTHEFGIGRLRGRDRTRVLQRDEDAGEVTLEARGRPAGRALVHLHVSPCRGGSLVTLREEPTSGPVRLVPRPLLDPLIAVRNRRGLAKLRAIVERHDPPTR